MSNPKPGSKGCRVLMWPSSHKYGNRFEVYVYVNPPPRSETFLLLKWAEIPKSERFSGIPTLLVDGPPRGSDPNQTWLVVFPPWVSQLNLHLSKKRCKWEDWGPRQVGLSRPAHFVEVSWLWLFECAWCSEFVVSINNTKHQKRGILILLKQQCYYLNWFRGTQPHCFFSGCGESKKPPLIWESKSRFLSTFTWAVIKNYLVFVGFKKRGVDNYPAFVEI